jgi:hypothetical protein
VPATPLLEPISTSSKLASRRRRRTRKLWWAVLAVVLLIGQSYGRALLAPGEASFSSRSVDWLRDHGAGHVIDVTENWWYTRSPPADTAIAAGDVQHLVLTFNSGFRMADTAGGFVSPTGSEGTLEAGLATATIDLAGNLDVVKWDATVASRPAVGIVAKPVPVHLAHGSGGRPLRQRGLRRGRPHDAPHPRGRARRRRGGARHAARHPSG